MLSSDIRNTTLLDLAMSTDIDRTQHYDMAAGIMLSWMILGHIASHASFECELLRTLGQQLSFFMPWFFYKSGRFHHSKPLSIVVKSGYSKLIVPFIVYSIIGQIIYYLCLVVEHNITFRSYVYQPLRSLFVTECLPGNGALWFLVVLFFVKILADIIIHKVHPLSPIFLGIIIAFTCYMSGVSWLPCLIPNVAAGLAFYVMGYWLRDYENSVWTIIVCLVVYVLMTIYGYPSIYFHHNTASSAVTYLLYFPASVSGIILLNNVCRILSPVINRNIFKWIGRNAMNLYGVHWIILVLFRLFVLDIFKAKNTMIIFTIYVIAMVILLPIFNTLINKVKANRGSLQAF